MKHTNIWVHWIIFLSVILVYASLWVISSVEWHISATLLTFVLLWVASSAPLQTLRFILGLIIFLLVLQLLFSSYVRDMLLHSLSSGFKWSDWSSLLFAVERLAWPLMIVTIFQSQLNDPRTAASLSSLLTPFRFLGINIARLHLSRELIDGKALVVFSSDSPISEEVLQKLKDLPNVISIARIEM